MVLNSVPRNALLSNDVLAAEIPLVVTSARNGQSTAVFTEKHRSCQYHVLRHKETADVRLSII